MKFDINKIKFEGGKEPSLHKKLTGQVSSELKSAGKGVMPNAELEGGEYFQYPDGLIQIAEGNKHSKGGIKMLIPDGTKIISNKLKLSSKDVKAIKEQFDIKLNTNMTYSKAMAAFEKKIGVKEINEDQEKAFKQLENQIKDEDISEGTMRINQEHLSKKIYDLENSRKEKEGSRSIFFNFLFNLQEAGKSPVKKEMSEKGNYKYGGVFSEKIKTEEPKVKGETFKIKEIELVPKKEKGGMFDDVSEETILKIAKKLGISESRAKKLIKNNVFDNGGMFEELKAKRDLTIDDVNKAFKDDKISIQEAKDLSIIIDRKNKVKALPFKATFNPITNVYSDPTLYPREHQSPTTTAYGSITNLENVMAQLYRNFPDIVSSPEVFGVKFDENGKIDWDRSISFNEVTENVRKFQSLANDRMKASAETIIANPNLFDEEQIQFAKDYLSKETFGTEEQTGELARDFDSKMGQFTAGRFIPGLDLVTPDELRALSSNNIHTVKQLIESLDKNPNLIGDESRERLEKLRPAIQGDADFLIANYNIGIPESGEFVRDPKEQKILDDLTVPPVRGGLNIRNIPQVENLPPEGLRGHRLADLNLGFIDPVKIGIEQQLKESTSQMSLIKNMMSGLNPVQRAVMASQLQAQQNEFLDDAAYKANVTNAQNLSSTELFNIGQMDRMGVANNQNKALFEQLQFTAEDKTRQNLRNYFLANQEQALNRFLVDTNLTALEVMYPDFNIGTDYAPVYSPDEDWGIQKSGNYGQIFGNPFAIT